jgi:hypothetical protein
MRVNGSHLHPVFLDETQMKVPRKGKRFCAAGLLSGKICLNFSST